MADVVELGLIKVVEEPTGLTPRGELVQQLLPVGRQLVKVAAPLHPAIAQFQKTHRAEDGYLYVLNLAVTAEETWGSNTNGDSFPRTGGIMDPGHGLLHKPTAAENWGADTFYQAGLFRHHQNKNPKLSQGGIALVVFNERMDRVELVQRRSLRKMEELGYGDTIRKLLAGEPVPTSMGTRVPFDICSACGNRARSRAEYCFHLLQFMNHVLTAEDIRTWDVNRPEWVKRRGGRVLQPGALVCAQNTRPRFFEMSDVFIGAEPQSYGWTLEKAASGRPPLSVDLAMAYDLHEWDERTAAEKDATIDKETPALAPAFAMDSLTRNEPSLPPNVLDTGAAFPAERLLSLLSLLGIVLKPEEFQRQDLVRSGDLELANALDHAHAVVPPVEGSEDIALSPEQGLLPAPIRALLAPWIGERSFHAPLLQRRLTIILQVGAPKTAPDERRPIDLGKLPGPVRERLEKTSARYNGYLDAVTNGLPRWIQEGQHDPSLTPYFAKTAGLRDQAAIYALFPLLYLFSKSRSDQEKGQSAFRHFVGRHPILTASFLAGAATTLPKLLGR